MSVPPPLPTQSVPPPPPPPQQSSAVPPPIPARPSGVPPPIPARPNTAVSASGPPPPPPPPQPSTVPAAAATSVPPPPPPRAAPSSSSCSTLLVPVDNSSTPSYVVSPKKTVSELLAQDASDDSLARYKASLLGGVASSSSTSSAKFPTDPRQVIFERVEIVAEGQQPIVMDIYDPNLKSKPFVLKEGVTFNPVLHFYVQHEIVSGLRFEIKIYKMGIKVDSSEEVIGSFAPSGAKPIVYKLPEENAPTGFIGRGSYSAEAKLYDDDGKIHAQFAYSFEVKKTAS